MGTKAKNTRKATVTPFAQATVQHAQALKAKSIKDVQIVSRIVTALGLRPPIKPATPLSKLLGGDANNWDIALFKTTNFGPENRFGIQFRTEFFNTFNRVQFGFPGTGFNGTANGNGFGVVTSQNNTPRLIQFALKFLF